MNYYCSRTIFEQRKFYGKLKQPLKYETFTVTGTITQFTVEFEFGLAAIFLQPPVLLLIYLCKFLNGNSRLVAVRKSPVVQTQARNFISESRRIHCHRCYVNTEHKRSLILTDMTSVNVLKTSRRTSRRVVMNIYRG